MGTSGIYDSESPHCQDFQIPHVLAWEKVGFVPAIKAPQKNPTDEVLQAPWITDLSPAGGDKLGFARLGFGFLGF